MGLWSRLDALTLRLAGLVPAKQVRPVGLIALAASAWIAFYGHLWSYERMDAHRFTARALLSGSLRMRSALSMLGGDEQVYNGAAYTNWGFGVPLLQAPFHAFASAVGLLHGFFPDRAIFWLYLVALLPAVWAAAERLLSECAPAAVTPAQRRALAATATWLVFAAALVPLISTRFIVYEETIAYFVVAELFAACCFVFSRRSAGVLPAAGLGAASGIAALIRPTGVLYVGVWLAASLREGRAKKVLVTLATCAPFLAFWCLSNHARTGSYFGLGFVNSTPGWNYNVPIERFGSRCSDSLLHVALGAVRLFTGFFLFVLQKPIHPWLRQCHFDFEVRCDGIPFFGPAVLAWTAWMAWKLAARGERRLEMFLPYALMSLMFAAFVYRGMGFAWRYAGDFWPAVVLATVQFVATGGWRDGGARPAPVAKAMFWYGLGVYLYFVVPWFWTEEPDVLPPSAAGAMAERYAKSQVVEDQPVPSRVACGDRLAPIEQNGAGWGPVCAVDTFTNLLLGVRPKEGGTYSLRARTTGMTAATVPVYVNGSYYEARRVGDDYEAAVSIPYAALSSKAVVVTFQWTRAFGPPGGELRSVELL